MSHIRAIRLQAADEVLENCSWYGGVASGARIYAYAGSDPINGTDPSGLAPGDGPFRSGQVGGAPDNMGGSQGAAGVGQGGSSSVGGNGGNGGHGNREGNGNTINVSGNSVSLLDPQTGLPVNSATTLPYQATPLSLAFPDDATVQQAQEFLFEPPPVELIPRAGIPRVLPDNPNDLLQQGYKDVTDPRNTSGNRDFYNPNTGDRLRFDPGSPDEPGFGQLDHYHRLNPDTGAGKRGNYLDKDGNPVPRGSSPSHLLPGGA